jgi:hypothetical protein
VRTGVHGLVSVRSSLVTSVISRLLSRIHGPGGRGWVWVPVVTRSGQVDRATVRPGKANNDWV